MIDPKLQGKVALITGANHGIGAATARALAAQGVSVLINYLRMPPLGTQGEHGSQESDSSTPGIAYYNARRNLTADEVVQAIRAEGGKVEAIEADLSLPETIPMLFERAGALFGPVDILVNNADHCVQDTFLPLEHNAEHLAPDGFPATTITRETIERHFAVNSRTVALMMAEFARRHIARKAQWGRIINLSTDGAPGFAGEVSYGASKAAIESYSRAAAKELGGYGITVNIVSPGPVQTGWIALDLEKSIAAETPLGRAGQPEDIANVIVFLASEQARWLTGQLISVSGGHRMI